LNLENPMSIKIKKLFLLAVLLKVGFSAIGWYLSDPWVFGLALPLSVMAAYIGLGMMRSKNDVSDEKFADSCYYLGFIFTISSIIFGLFDLPQIGAKMSEIAVRFGAAMVTTVAGLVVRVYLVNFRADFNDAINQAETGIIAASQRLSEQLAIELEKMRAFDARIDEAVQTTVARAAVGVEKLSQTHGEKLAEFCANLMEQNKLAFANLLQEAGHASERLASSVDAYAAAVSQRMAGVTFPEDYFAKRLEAPVNKLSAMTEAVAERISGVGVGIAEAFGDLRPTVSEVRTRADEIADNLGRIIELATIQSQIVSGAQSQIDTLGLLAATLKSVQEDIARVAEAASSQSKAAAVLANSARNQNSGLLTSTKELTSIRQALTLTNSGISAIHRILTEQQNQTSERTATLETALQKLVGQIDPPPAPPSPPPPARPLINRPATAGSARAKTTAGTNTVTGRVPLA
jgi:low affinity Fe/Cu permease